MPTLEAQPLSQGEQRLGQLLARGNSIPKHIQLLIGAGALVSFVILWQLDAAPVFVLIPATFGGSLVFVFIAFRIPALRTSLAIHEHGLKAVVQGKAATFTYDELTAIADRYTDQVVNHQVIATWAKIEFFVEGRLTPHVYHGELSRGRRSERLILAALDRCSQAIERKLLVQLERDGAVRWRDNVSLTPDGLLLADPSGSTRLIPYGQIDAWKVEDDTLKIWKTNAALPFFEMSNDALNFRPLLGLFLSLCQATRNLETAQPVG